MPQPATCDIFCTVIDNFGDVGVCWRLASDLAARGWPVRLWLDDASALAWMAPDGTSASGVRVLAWREPLDLSAAGLDDAPCGLLIEAFGCEVPPAFVAACAAQAAQGDQRPVWINLEYLSAEGYVERSHGLPSPVREGPAAGWTKWFFYPGFTPATGGLLHEPGLAAAQASFDRDAWLAGRGIAVPSGELLVSLFCYEPPALVGFLSALADGGLAGQPVRLLVAAGRAEQAVDAVLAAQPALAARIAAGAFLSLGHPGLMSQADFDRLLWACDLNFVRGEDSLVRALWAGKPLVWHIYPQDDEAHVAKLEAFLASMDFPASLRDFHRAWNAADAAAPTLPDRAQFKAWQAAAEAVRQRLASQDDLVTRLLGFVAKNR